MLPRPDLKGATAALAVIAVLLLALALAARAWDGLTGWLPWSDEARLERAEVRLDDLQAELETRQAQVASLERQAASAHAAHQTLARARAVTARATAQAETAADAEIPLDPDRLARLRDADRRLCALAPELCGDGSAAAPGS